MKNRTEEIAESVQTGIDFDRRVIYAFGTIDEEMAYRIVIALHLLDNGKDDINIVMSSGGGTESSGYAIYDAIMGCSSKVIINGYGIIASIAASIFQAADIRKLAVNAEFMIHNGYIINTSNEITSQDSIVSTAAKILEDNQKYYQILADRSGLNLTQIQELCKMETYMSAENAVKNGFADSLIPHVKLFKSKKKRKK